MKAGVRPNNLGQALRLILLFVADETGVTGTALSVTVTAVVHLHSIPAIGLQPGYPVAPNIDAVTGKTVFFIHRQYQFLVFGSVASLALYICQLYVGGV